MPPPYVAVKNLDTYQHYKHRNPPWVKLHYSVLDDPAFLALNEVQQCRYIKLIMLASRQLNCISTDPEYLGRVMRISEQVDVTPLIDAGFLIASRKRQQLKMLAPPHENRSQSRVEKSRVEKSREEPPKSPKGDDGFDVFWSTYNYKVSKVPAKKAWTKLKPNEELQATILAAISAQQKTEKWTKDNGKFRKHPSTWLSSKCWEDEISTPPAPPHVAQVPLSPAEPHPIWGKTVYAKDVWYCGCYKNDPTPCRSLDHGKTLEEVQQQ